MQRSNSWKNVVMQGVCKIVRIRCLSKEMGAMLNNNARWQSFAYKYESSIMHIQRDGSFFVFFMEQLRRDAKKIGHGLLRRVFVIRERIIYPAHILVHTYAMPQGI